MKDEAVKRAARKSALDAVVISIGAPKKSAPPMSGEGDPVDDEDGEGVSCECPKCGFAGPAEKFMPDEE